MRHHEQYLQWPVSEAAATSLNGVQLTGGEQISVTLNGSVYRYTLMGGNLLIGRGSNAGATMNGTITVQGWTATESLGIILDNTPVVNPVTGALFFNGDQRAKLIGTETQLNITPDKPALGTYAWSETSWANDGTLNNGISDANFEDVIDASAAGANGSVIHGYGGNDALSGSIGRDDIFGDAGSDNIRGGAGNDWIYSATGLSAPQRLNPADDWVAPVGATVIIEGSTWGVYATTNPITEVSTGAGAIAMDDAPDVIDVIDAGDGEPRYKRGRSEQWRCCKKHSELVSKYEGYCPIRCERKATSPKLVPSLVPRFPKTSRNEALQ